MVPTNDYSERNNNNKRLDEKDAAPRDQNQNNAEGTDPEAPQTSSKKDTMLVQGIRGLVLQSKKGLTPTGEQQQDSISKSERSKTPGRPFPWKKLAAEREDSDDDEAVQAPVKKKDSVVIEGIKGLKRSTSQATSQLAEGLDETEEKLKVLGEVFGKEKKPSITPMMMVQESHENEDKDTVGSVDDARRKSEKLMAKLQKKVAPDAIMEAVEIKTDVPKVLPKSRAELPKIPLSLFTGKGELESFSLFLSEVDVNM